MAASHFQYAVGDEVLSGPVGFDDCRHHVLGDVLEVGQELLGVLREAVAAVTEGGVIVMGADARVEADAVDDFLCVEAFGLCVGIQLIEVGDAEGQVGVSEELYSFGFGEAHEQGVDVFLQSALLEERREDMGPILAGIVAGDDDPGGIQVIVQRLGFAEEFGAENQVLRVVLLSGSLGEAHGDSGFDDHGCSRVDFEDLFDDGFHGGAVEEVLFTVVVGGSRDDDEVGGFVSVFRVQGGGQVKFLLGQIFFDVFVLDGGDTAVNHVHFFGDDVHGCDVVMLRQECGDGQAHVARTGHGDVVTLSGGGGGECGVAGGGICAVEFCRILRCGGRRSGFFNEELGQVEVQGFRQTLQLIDGGDVVLLFQAADHGAVDAGDFGNLHLGQAFFFSQRRNGLGHFIYR